MAYELPKVRSPWAYFWPVTLAVMLGSLAADGVRLVVAAVGLAAVADQASDVGIREDLFDQP